MYLNDKIKRIIREKIYQEVNPEKVILFGSYAYGNANDESDIDIMVIENELKTSKIKESIKIRNVLEDIKIPKDIIVLSNDEFEFYKNEPGSVIRDAYERGEIL